MADLKTNYVDDVLDTTKNQLRKYQQIQNDDGTVSFVDVTEYTQVGTSFGAKDINDTNAAINDVNGKLQTANLYLGDIIKVSANVTTIGWHNNDINIPTAAKIDGYEFVEYILSADTYRISGISHSGSSITYYVNTVGTSANINCIPLYKRL